MSKLYNLILCKHRSSDINRVFALPEDVDVYVGSTLLVDTAMAKDQLVYSTSDNFVVREEDLDDYLAMQNTNRRQLKTIKGFLRTELFDKKTPEEEDSEEEEESETWEDLEGFINDVKSLALKHGLELVGPGFVELKDE